MTFRHALIALAAAATTAGAQAAVIFSDNFDGNTTGLSKTPSGWTVTNGTVDIIGTSPTSFDLLPGNGAYIDLDGSSGNAGELSISLNLTAGVSYTASYFLAGNRRGGNDTVTVTFGSASQSHTLAATTGFTPFSLDFTPLTTGSYTLMFANAGGDNVGLLLDRVTVRSADVNDVPTPPSLALALAGLLALGALRRRA